MENIVQSNNRDLRLVGVKVGVLSTLRLILPDVPANATRVEAIVTQGDTHTAYTAHLDSATEHWIVDVAAAQFPVCGKQKYEVAYLLDGKQFWDGQGWITVEDATTGGITPSPAPDPARYVVTRINGYGAPNPDGEVRIPRTFVGTEDPTTTDGFIEFDQLFNRVTGALFVLCSVRGELTWVKSYITLVSTTFTSSDAGKAADAKAVGEALKGKLDWFTSGQGATLEFADDFMYFSNSYGSNSIFYPNSVGNHEKDSELAHDGMEIFATRVWINWFLAQDTTKAALFAGADFREAAFGKAAMSAANLESGNVAVVDGSAGGTVTVSFKANATGDNSLRYCELLVTGVTADDAVTISLPAGTYQFADGADKTSTGNNHFVFAEYAGGWMVNKTVRTEATITEG